MSTVDTKMAPAVAINSGRLNNCLIFLDYDIDDLDSVVKDAHRVKNALKLGPFEVVSTNKGFHAIFWWDAVNEATRDTAIEMSKADESFKQKPKKSIRVGGKYESNDLRHVAIFKADNDTISTDGIIKMRLAAIVGSSLEMSPGEGLSTKAPEGD